MKRRFLSMLLAFAMVLTIAPVSASAEALDPGTSPDQSGLGTEEGVAYLDPDEYPTNAELLEGYIWKMFSGEDIGGSTFSTGTQTAGSLLTGTAKTIYEAVAPEIVKIAAQGGSTKFTNPGGVTSGITNEITKQVLDALCFDYPYEMYWHGLSYGGGSGNEFILYVATEYQGENAQTVDSEKAKEASDTIANASGNAQAILNKAASLSPLAKLIYFKEAICELVSYNYKAADKTNNVAYGNPWQMIWVFDGDKTNQVVCEGYAKAFQYLCDKAFPNGPVQCYTVTGTMDGENHMWNIVTLDGSAYYLVDVTNCERETGKAEDGSDLYSSGYPYGLFLVGAEGSPTSGYTVKKPQVFTEITRTTQSISYGAMAPTTISYAYDKDLVWGNSTPLTLSSTDYPLNFYQVNQEKLYAETPYTFEPILMDGFAYDLVAMPKVDADSSKGWVDMPAVPVPDGMTIGEGGTITYTPPSATDSEVLVPLKVTYGTNSYSYYVTIKLPKVEAKLTKPEVEAIGPLTATAGSVLSSVQLPQPDNSENVDITPGTWAWKDPNQNVGNEVGDKMFVAVFTPEETDTYQVITQDVLVKVQKSIADCNVTLTPEAAVFNGENPTVTVSVTDNGTGLTQGTDYQVAWKDEKNGSSLGYHAGTYTATISGIGNYTGSVTKTFKITATDAYTFNLPSTINLNPAVGDKYPQTSKATATFGSNLNLAGTLKWFKDVQCTDANKVTDSDTFAEAGTTVTLYWKFTVDNDTSSNIESNDYQTKTGSQNFTVTALPTLNVTVEDPGTKTYGDAAFTLVPKATKADGTEVTPETYTYAVTGGTDVASVDNTGNVTIKKAGTATISVTAKATGYADSTGNITITVNKRQLTVAGATLAPKTYDGTTDATVTKVEFNGLVGSDTLTLGTNYTAKAQFKDANAGEDKLFDVTVTMTHDNYTVATPPTFSNGTITPKTLTIPTLTWNVQAEGYPWTGELQTLTLTGENDLPEELTVTKEGHTGTAVGDYKAKATIDLKGGLVKENYTISGSETLPKEITTTWKITKASWENKTAAQSVNVTDKEVKTVDLSKYVPSKAVNVSYPAVTVTDADSIIASDCSVTTAGVLSFKLADSEIAAKTTADLIVTVTSDNYADFTVTVTVNTTNKKVVTPVITVAQDLVYDGTAKTTGIVTEVTNSEGYEGPYEYTYSPTEVKNAGEYTVTVKVPASNAEYEGENAETFMIAQKPITVKANDAEIVQDGTPALGYTVTPALATGDTWATEPKVVADSTKFGTVGTYTGAITVSGGVVSSGNSNYTIAYQPGDLVVTPKIEGQVTLSANPVSGTALPENGTVTLSSNPADATIYYTLDGTNPVVGTSPTYSTPIPLTGDTLTIKAIAVKAGMNDSAVATFTYTKQPTVVDPDPQPPVQQVATPVIEPAGGQFYTNVQVRITCATPGATVYYSINNGAFNVFTDAFVLTDSAVVRAYAMAPGMTDSSLASASFTRYTYTPDPTPDPDPDPEPDNDYEPPVSSNNNNSNNNSNNSSNSSNSSTTQPTTPTQPETPAVPEVTARPEATVDGGTASAAVPAETVEKLVEQAVSGKSGTLVIAPVITGGVTKAEVTLPANAVAAIANETNASLRVETPVAEVTIPNGSLAGLGNQGAEIAVTAEKSEDGGVDVAVVVDGQRVENVPIKAAIPTPCGPGTVAKIVDANGNVISTVRKSSASGDGQTMNVPLDGSAKVVFVDSGKSFPDVPATNWAADAVAFASSHELMNGVNEETFSPSTPMTRGMLAVVLHNLEGNPGASYQGGFSDVTGSAWYAEAVQWASEKKVVTGLSDGVFAPDSPITREQLVVMLYRYMGEPAVSGSSLGRFSDSGTVSGWAAQAMSWAVANGVVNGSNGALNPQGSATRAEVAQMLMNFVSSGML